MKGSWLDAGKSSAKAVAAAKAEGCKPNQQSKDYGMTIQQQHKQTEVLAGPLMNGSAITMSSLDFWDNVISPARRDAGEPESTYQNFLSKVKDEIDDLGPEEKHICEKINELGFSRKYKTPYHMLNFDQLMLTGMRESKAVRRSVLAKLKALDEQVRTPPVDPMAVLNDPAAMRGILLTYTEKVLVLEEQVEAMKPDVEALERIAKADGSLNLTEAAKALQQQPKKFNQYLGSLSWIYRRAGNNRLLGYQDKVQQGLLEHKVTTITLPDGSERLSEQVRITPKGLAKLAKMLGVVQ